MKKNLLLVILMIATLIVSCIKQTTPAEVPVVIESVKLDRDLLSLVVGGQATLVATLKPVSVEYGAVEWSSSNANVATVDIDGRVTAVAVGQAVILVKTKNGGRTATCIVTVISQSVAVVGVELDRKQTSIVIGDNLVLLATVTPTNATNKDVEWSSDKPAIASVDAASGLVKGLAEGGAIITVTTKDGGKTATCTVTVQTQLVPVSAVSFDKPSLSVVLGSSSTLTAIVNPSNATTKDVVWSSDKPTIATVDGRGVVTGVALGDAVITVTTKDGAKTAICLVTVIDVYVPVTGITLDQTAVTLVTGKSTALRATIAPALPTNPNISWASDKPAVAIVDARGVVSAISVGVATITVTTENGAKTASCVVTVEPIVNVTGITFPNPRVWLKMRQKAILPVNITPANATNKTVIWESSNPLYASIDSDGQLTGIKAGTVVIIATTADGNFSSKCAVEVRQIATGVTLNKTNLSLTVGGKETLVPTVVPAVVIDKSVIWTSNNHAVATVDDAGLVTAVSVGTVEISVVSVDGGAKAICAVSVTN